MTSSNEDIIFCGALGPVMCRFSAAGDDHFTTPWAAGGGKPPKHEAQSRDEISQRSKHLT